MSDAGPETPDLTAVLARIAALEAELAATAPRKLYEVRGNSLPQSYRELRRLAAAVAIARGEPVPGAAVPSCYVPIMRQLYALRRKGVSWRTALVEVGLEPPAAEVVAEHARTLRAELPSLYDALRPALGLLQLRGAPVAAGAVLARVGCLMT